MNCRLRPKHVLAHWRASLPQLTLLASSALSAGHHRLARRRPSAAARRPSLLSADFALLRNRADDRQNSRPNARLKAHSPRYLLPQRFAQRYSSSNLASSRIALPVCGNRRGLNLSMHLGCAVTPRPAIGHATAGTFRPRSKDRWEFARHQPLHQ